jgi:exodeoxyribonuclease III
MKIATWNVNSIRMRIEHLVDWLTDNPVDVLCLQETKVVDEKFPHEAIAAIGYQATVFGQPSYNGVALLSREPLQNINRGFAGILGQSASQAVNEPVSELVSEPVNEPVNQAVAELDAQKRVIMGTLNGVRILNLYVPNGSSVGSDKYLYKLRWLATLQETIKTLLLENSGNLLICGDFNIALHDIDIYDATGRENQVMATDLERQALQALLDLGLADVFRKFTLDEGQFSWWDYRAAAFRRNLGWRIDHIYLTADLYAQAIACTIDTAPRKLEKPSDHTPVIVEL